MSPIAEYDALRADVYRLLARLVREAPDTELLEFLAGLEMDDAGELRAYWAALALAAANTQPKPLERAHFRHLIGVIQGDLLPYASWYLTGSLMELPLVELRQDLQRLGFERAAHTREPEDHFAAMCEVMAMLIETDPAEQSPFFQRHLAPWGPDFMTDLAAVDTPFYASVGQLGRVFLQQDQHMLEESGEPVRLIDSAQLAHQRQRQ